MSEERSVDYLIIGGGAAAAQASVGIRQQDTDGLILVTCGEDRLPYDRPPLSKGILMSRMEPEDAESKDPSFYTDNFIEVWKGAWAKSIDRHTNTVQYADGRRVHYGKLLIATGSVPIRPEIPGADLPNVFVYRSADDALAVRSLVAPGKSVVIVGAGYVGLEVADRLVELGVKVSIVERHAYPWSRLGSPVVGDHLKSYLEKRGISLYLNDEVVSIEGTELAESVVTHGGYRLAADLIIFGVGVHLNVALAQEAGLEIDAEHGVVVHENLRSSDPSIFIAGDIAAFPDVTSDRRWHAEHQLNAKWQGLTAGRNMAGAHEIYNRIAYFFSDLIDTHMILRGDIHGARNSRVLGNPATGEFVELFERADSTLAGGIAFSTVEKHLDPISDRLEELIREGASVVDLNAEMVGLPS